MTLRYVHQPLHGFTNMRQNRISVKEVKRAVFFIYFFFFNKSMQNRLGKKYFIFEMYTIYVFFSEEIYSTFFFLMITALDIFDNLCIFIAPTLKTR